MKHLQLSYSNSGAPINNVKIRGDQISWMRQPRPIAKKLASTFKCIAQHLRFVTNDKKEPPLPNRLFLV